MEDHLMAWPRRSLWSESDRFEDDLRSGTVLTTVIPALPDPCPDPRTGLPRSPLMYRSLEDVRKIAKARHFAEAAHGDQTRKYSGLPYMVHLDEVAMQLMLLDNPATTDTIIAAYL